MANITVQVANFSTSERTESHELNPGFSQGATNEQEDDLLKNQSIETVTILKPTFAEKVGMMKPAPSESPSQRKRKADEEEKQR